MIRKALRHDKINKIDKKIEQNKVLYNNQIK